MRDSDTNMDWHVGAGIAVILCIATIGGGLLGDAMFRMFFGG